MGRAVAKRLFLRELKKRGYQTCPEAYSELFKEAKIAGTLSEFLQLDLNQRCMLMRKQEELETQLDPSNLLF